MRKYLGFDTEQLINNGGSDTAREIAQQPSVWLKIWKQANEQASELVDFLNTAKKADKVILTGAGTSAFIGQSLIGAFHRNYHNRTEAVSTTHLVSNPMDYFSKDSSVLLVSFARSGNSPESMAAVLLAEQLSGQCHHLIITCNQEGELFKCELKSNKYTFLLPPETNDKSLAMTSSYSGMLLAGLLAARIKEIAKLEAQVTRMAKYGNRILDDCLPMIQRYASLPFSRSVFLGSGSLYGTATESHLKLQELTDGQVICKYDSYLGFRHGPKAVVDEDTLVVFHLSNNRYISGYERDLIFGMAKGKPALGYLYITEQIQPGLPEENQIVFASGESDQLEEDFLCIPQILPTQILGFYKSINLGYSPDSPSKSGAIARVVEGVNIYELI